MFLSLFILSSSKKFKLRNIQPSDFQIELSNAPAEHHPKGQRITISGQVKLSESVEMYPDDEMFYVVALTHPEGDTFGQEFYSADINSDGEWKQFTIVIDGSENYGLGKHTFTIFARTYTSEESEQIETYFNVVDPSDVPVTPGSDSKPTITGPDNIASQYNPSDDIKFDVTVTDDKGFEVYYKFDEGEEKPCSDKYPSSPRTGIKITLKIDIPDSLEPGHHQLHVYAKDDADQASETPLVYNFEVIRENKPRLRNVHVSKTEVHNQEFVKIKGEVIYPESGEQISVKIIFGEYHTDEIYVGQSDGTWKQFEMENYAISSDVPVGKIRAFIRAYHRTDTSDDIVIPFEIKNDDPEIAQRTPEPTPDPIVPDVPELFAPGSIDAEYRPSQSLPIVVNVSSKYAFKVYYKFDDSDEVEATIEYPQTNGAFVTISLNIEFPEDLQMGSEHRFIVYARGDNRKSTEYIYKFNFLEEIIPKIKSLNAPDSVTAGNFMDITGEYENPSGHVLDLYYKLNEEDEQSKTDFAGETENSIHLTISAPGYNQNVNKLVIRLYDTESNLYSRPKTVTFSTTDGYDSTDPTNSKPEIVEAPASINPNYDVGQNIEIAIKVKDEKKFRMCYKFDSRNETVLETEYPSTSTPTPLNLQITIPSTLSPGQHTISIYAKDESGQDSDPKTYTFNINADQTPVIGTLTVNPESQEQYGFVTVSGTVSVEATGKTIKLKVIFTTGESSDVTVLEDKSTGQPQNFEITFTNPYGEVGAHTARVHAETDPTYSAEKEFSYSVRATPPDPRDPILIVEQVKSKYGNDEQISIKVKIQADANFNIYYNLGGEDTKITQTEIQKQWNPPYEHNYDLTLPEDIVLGSKVLTIYVQDNNEKRATKRFEIEIIQAQKPYIRKCTSPKYNVFQEEKVEITCEIMHPRVGQTTRVLYEVDGDERDIGTLILNDGWETFKGEFQVPFIDGAKTFKIFAIDEADKRYSPYVLNFMVYENEQNVPTRTPTPEPDPNDNDPPVIAPPDNINSEYEVTDAIEFDMSVTDDS
ncbi:hypothetical protein TVAG_025750 [Trichomonas vaginalis G3]|uniref:Bap-like n=1 Tax=Trichomonas vaginalis (strain ATCC PRA-98 / G3) TaxID=412133 RepID=A2F0J7_TRIV3|nr:ribonuclease H protein family [Trichomonas vaginalis G3]EAY01577.1 hypothetical protein TVAG_025750 [Trichomonas vaginalis G3]KAI5529808.1 ribonuclease H protein family [Trichomonas vaginalis G3]|eukprot:XP_001314218.1 hypothetical protein [Trichomonas vaginalis G3]